MAKHNQTGEMGETITANFLKRKGFEIICRNYRKKWGEIDIVVLKDNKVHFVEVKTVSRRSIDGSFPKIRNNYSPEDNMHPWKVQRLRRAIQTYILENKNKISALKGESEWQFDLACLYLDAPAKVAKIRYIENLIL
jgi:putative endonuclease